MKIKVSKTFNIPANTIVFDVGSEIVYCRICAKNQKHTKDHNTVRDFLQEFSNSHVDCVVEMLKENQNSTKGDGDTSFREEAH